MNQNTCSAPGCARGVHVQKYQLCNAHYQQRRLGQPFTEPRARGSYRVIPDAACWVGDCERRATFSDGLCSPHHGNRVEGKPWSRLQLRSEDFGGVCQVEGCGRPYKTGGYCGAHYLQVLNHGRVTSVRVKRPVDTRNELGEKWCFGCDAWLPESEFNKQRRSKDGLQSSCRECGSRRYKENAEAVRDKMRQARFNITRAEFDTLLASQGGRCAICLTDDPGASYWHVDHDHACCPAHGESCGRCVRGVLCARCNAGLGQFRDDRDSLRRAIAYLEGYALADASHGGGAGDVAGP